MSLESQLSEGNKLLKSLIVQTKRTTRTLTMVNIINIITLLVIAYFIIRGAG